MKRFIVTLLLFLCIFISSCKKQETPGGIPYNYEETKGNIDYNFPESNISLPFRFLLKIYVDEASYTLEHLENDVAAYEAYTDSKATKEQLVDKKEKKSYDIDSANQAKYLLDKDITFEDYKEYIDYHKNLDKRVFILDNENVVDYRGNDAFVYYHNKTVSNIIMTEKCYLSNDLSICYGYELVISEGDVTIKKGFYFETISYDEILINSELNKYLGYEEKYKTTFYESWPSTTLAKLLPEFRAGNYSTIWDSVTEFYVFKTQVSKMDADSYAGLLKEYGFKDYKVRTLDKISYEYMTYNDDYILVIIKISTDEQSLSIDVTVSNEDEINQVIKRFK